jgi:hypothetical protein
MAFVVVVASFALFFHLPRAGTVTLNLDQGWILPTGLEYKFTSKALNNVDRVNALRLRALVALLPQRPNKARAFRSLDDIAPPEVRAQYRDAYERVMGMDTRELKQFVEDHPAPDDFKLGLAPIPISMSASERGITLASMHMLNTY